jgi:hypothetical protein
VVGTPFVMASAGDGAAVEATISSFVVTTCSNTSVGDAVVEPSVPLRAGPAHRLRFTLPEAWRFLHWAELAGRATQDRLWGRRGRAQRPVLSFRTGAAS